MRGGGSEYRGDKLADLSNGFVEFEGEAHQIYSFQIAVLFQKDLPGRIEDEVYFLPLIISIAHSAHAAEEVA